MDRFKIVLEISFKYIKLVLKIKLVMRIIVKVK